MDITTLRSHTPGVADHIHFNNAGASLPTFHTLDSISLYLKQEAQKGGYYMQDASEALIRDTYQQIATLIHADEQEIALTTNASTSFFRALLSIPWKKGDVLLTSELEYGNNYLHFLYLKEKEGIDIQVVAHGAHGVPEPEAIAAALDDRVKLVALTHMPTNSGVVSPAAAIGKICRKHGILFLLDACQTVGQIPLDVQKIRCDFLSATSRKYLRGPRGLGFLYVRKEVLPQLRAPFLDMNAARWTGKSSYELEKSIRMFEEWEKSYALIVGLGAAAAYANKLHQQSCWTHIQALAAYMREGLADNPSVEVHDKGAELGGIVSFSKKDLDPEKIKSELNKLGVRTSVSYASSSLLDMQSKKLAVVNRASLHYFNTIEEVNIFLSFLENM